jgi:hypothetical protein
MSPIFPEKMIATLSLAEFSIVLGLASVAGLNGTAFKV